MKEYTLVILAAGMGSRYGGTKQLDTVSDHRETIMDFSLFDAIRAGFTKIVFIVRRDILEEVRTDFNQKINGKVAVEYVCQETNDIPEKYRVNNRVKPWGTGHALLVAKELIKENFCVINADDFYGFDAFKSIISFLKETDPTSTNFAMVGYPIINTLSDNGSVSRGESFVNSQHELVKIIERTAITKKGNDIVYMSDDDVEVQLPKDTLVSLNFWGFTPKYLALLEQEFTTFLESNSQELKEEFFLPYVVDELIQANKATVSVLKTSAEWMGVTYKEDKEAVVKKVKILKEKGVYPAKLW
ncbi:MAG: sugar phosphate nucleotidyltransferase [Polaribacter sp.]|nr:sugar phosphate nucleotidyltransferase [Polaribacter sp.]